MLKIDEILNMLNYDNRIDKQTKGIKLAKKVITLKSFIMPYDKCGGKKLWDNCAKIICNRNFEDLLPYIFDILLWLKDLKEPGAKKIYEFLKIVPKNLYEEYLKNDFEDRKKEALLLHDILWYKNLYNLQNEIMNGG